MSFEIRPFDVGLALDLARLDGRVRRRLGSVYSHQDWGETQFEMDLPSKPELSRVAVDERGRLIGFWIASRRKRRTAHTHRVAVDEAYAGQGVAGAMFEAVRSTAVKLRCRDMTVSVSAANEQAQEFYHGLGFRPLLGGDLRRFVKRTRRPGRIRDGAIEEQGFRYLLLRCGLARIIREGS